MLFVNVVGIENGRRVFDRDHSHLPLLPRVCVCVLTELENDGILFNHSSCHINATSIHIATE